MARRRSLDRAVKIALLAAAATYTVQQLVGWAAPMFHSWLHMLASMGG